MANDQEKRLRAETKGQQVWLPVQDDDVWVLATVEDMDKHSVTLRRLHGPKGTDLETRLSPQEFSRLSLVAGEADVMDVDNFDLAVLKDVSDATILHTLRLRYDHDEIFSAIGPVLVVLNPYRAVACCSQEAIAKLTTEAGTSAKVRPHCHRTVSAAYAGLVQPQSGRPQSVLVSGESGAGKTETAKLCMTCLAKISQSTGTMTEGALESSFLLEAFGNAKTVYNDNSSRFGKWCAVYFDKKNRISACQIRSYLLEQSRVVGPSDGERNYHAFYYMLAASDEVRKPLGLGQPATAMTYTKSSAISAHGIDDVQGWSEMMGKLDTVGFSADERECLFRLLAAVLLVGEVTFKGEKDEQQEVANREQLNVVAAALKIPGPMLAKVLTTRIMSTGHGSMYAINLTREGCIDSRDALAKAIYSQVFDNRVIARLNEALGGNTVADDDDKFIGFLDIFGFENFENNSFEQLCINFTNEKLQSFFTDALIKRQQEEYAREGVTCSHISFPDNAAQIELCDAPKGRTVFSLLDEECLVPQGTDEGYVSKLANAFGKHTLWSLPRVGRRVSHFYAANPELAKMSFVITHYAGEVQYNADRWLEKNRGSLHADIVQLLTASDDDTLSNMFSSYQSKSPSVGFVYRASLRALSDTIRKTDQHYIRCLKPNFQKKPDTFNGEIVSRQLRYTGCSAVVEIQRSGYPISFKHSEFIKQYKCIAFDSPSLYDLNSISLSKACANLLWHAQQLIGERDESKGWVTTLRVQIGKTKVFMRDDVLRHLEGPRRAVTGRAGVCIQRYARGYLVQRTLSHMRFHIIAAPKIRAALDKEDVRLADTLLKELKEKWAGQATASSGSPLMMKMLAQLTEMESDLEDIRHQRDLTFEDGDRYKGGWKNDTMNGKGTYYYQSGNVYVGQWKEGLKHGTGTHTWANGQVYTGQWGDDTMQGAGVFTFPSGSKYEGQYHAGLRHGEGRFTDAKGSVYEGAFVDGKKHGTGTYSELSGLRYEGDWVNDKQHGEGKLVTAKGAVYEGGFVGGKKEGFGKFSDPSGVQYEGEFVDGQREGHGKYINPNGSIAFEGTWQADKPVQDIN